MDRKIFITGDSWGVKEWTKSNYDDDSAAHRGLQTYFTDDGYQVHNKSSGGSSNKDSIIRLIDYLDENPALYNRDQDRIFWIVTDPIRDLRPYTFPTNKIENEIIVNNGWNNLITELFHRQCSRANYLAEQRNLKLHLIGGVVSFDPKEVASYKNLIPVLPSWHSLLLTDEERVLVPNRPVWNSQNSDIHIDEIKLKYIRSMGRKDLVEGVVNDLWEISEFHRRVHSNNKYFSLDHSHPDRYGHKLAYNEIIKWVD